MKQIVIREIKEEDITTLAAIAFEEYQKECKFNPLILRNDITQIRSRMEKTIRECGGFAAVSGGEAEGFILKGYEHRAENISNYYLPLEGYGCTGKDREKIMSLLFQKLAEELVKEGKYHFEIKVYAHDTEIQRMFSFLQFGIECEQEICNIYEEKIDTDIIFRKLTKDELKVRWTEVWGLTEKIIKHLTVSPVFYPSEAFTEEMYYDFFSDEATNVFVAEKDNKLIGLIETNPDKNDFITGNELCNNIGEVFVEEAYRGTDIAKGLFLYANYFEKEEGTKQLWVEHGTANPNGKRFWNKYFSAYCYTMTRDIEIRK